MNDDLARRIELGSFFGGGAGHEGDAVKQGVEAIVGAGDDAFGEDDQRALGFFHHFHGGVEGGAVHSFAVDGKCASAAKHEGLDAALHEEVPAGHDVDAAAGAINEFAHKGRVGVAAVVGGEHDAVAGGDGFIEEFHAVHFDGFDAEVAAGVPAEDVNQDARPELAVDGGDEVIGFVDDDVLHQG